MKGHHAWFDWVGKSWHGTEGGSVRGYSWASSTTVDTEADEASNNDDYSTVYASSASSEKWAVYASEGSSETGDTWKGEG